MFFFQGFRAFKHLTIYLTKHNIQGTNNGYNISQHVVLSNHISSSQVSKSWSLDLTPERKQWMNLHAKKLHIVNPKEIIKTKKNEYSNQINKYLIIFKMTYELIL